MFSTKSLGNQGLEQLGEGAPRVGTDDRLRGQLGPVLEGDADGCALFGDHRRDRGVEHDLGAVGLGRPCQHLGEAAVAALVERPGAEVPVVLPESGTAGRARTPGTSARPWSR